jgi:hypothetical protein
MTRTKAAERYAQFREYRQAKDCEYVRDLPRNPHKGRSVAEGAPKPVKRRRIADNALSTGIRRLGTSTSQEARANRRPWMGGYVLWMVPEGVSRRYRYASPLPRPSDDEWTWLNTVGPDVLPKNLEREWRKRVRFEQRRRIERN